MTASAAQFGGPIAIRPAHVGDTAAIASLWVELISFHAELDPRFAVPLHGHAKYQRHVLNALRDDNSRVFVAEAEIGLVGYVMGYVGHNPPIFPAPRYGFIADLCVTGGARRRGIGRRLVRAMCAWFRDEGLTNVQMNVAHANAVSQGFWRKLGSADYLAHMWLDLTQLPTEDAE